MYVHVCAGVDVSEDEGICYRVDVEDGVGIKYTITGTQNIFLRRHTSTHTHPKMYTYVLYVRTFPTSDLNGLIPLNVAATADAA